MYSAMVYSPQLWRLFDGSNTRQQCLIRKIKFVTETTCLRNSHKPIRTLASDHVGEKSGVSPHELEFRWVSPDGFANRISLAHAKPIQTPVS